jgi:dihydrofolate reductase
MSIVLIAAMDKQRGIGRSNALPWHLPNDLKRFKALTLNQTILMGRKTAESLGRALPKRSNLVLSRSGAVPYAGMQSVQSVDEAQQCAGDSPLFVIGGGEIYLLCLPRATRMHLTLVDAVVDNADAFFPEFDWNDWHVNYRQHHPADSEHVHAFEFVDLVR